MIHLVTQLKKNKENYLVMIYKVNLKSYVLHQLSAQNFYFQECSTT